MAPAKEGHPSWGEPIDNAAHDAIRLAHKALERFPQVIARHKYIAGGAAFSSSLVVLAGVAIARRMRDGESAEEAVASVTEEEVQGLVHDPEDEARREHAPRANGHAGSTEAVPAGATPAATAVTTPEPAGVNGSRPSSSQS